MTELSSKILSSDKSMAAVNSLVKTLICEMVRIEHFAGTSESTCPSIDSVQEYAIFLSRALNLCNCPILFVSDVLPWE